MGGLLAAIAGLATPILARILIALGLSVVTIAGGAAAITTVRTMITSNISDAGMVGVGVQIAGLMGVWDALGMILGAVTFTMSLYALTKVVRAVAG